MDAATRERRRYRFGAYEVNSDALELRKNGVRIKIREQAFQILIVMLERPGELITREEFRQRLWPDDTFVNFDKSLNTGVNKLRDILSDSAVNPRFVETVPRHGYRFIAEVRKVTEVDEKLSEKQPSLVVLATPKKADVSAIVLGDSASRSIPALFWATVGFLAAATLAWFGYRAFWPVSTVENLRALPLTSYAGVVRSPSFSPDGSQFAFAWTREDAPNSDIYVQAVGASDPLRLTVSPNSFGPAWSPDGSLIGYLQDGTGDRFNIMVIAPTGGQPRKLGDLSYPFVQAMAFRSELLSWTPDGKFLVFPDAGEGERTAIWRVNVTSGLRERITDPKPPIRGQTTSRISADGRRLAYQQLGGRYLYQLLIVPLDPNGRPAGEPLLIDHNLNTCPIAWVGTDLVFFRREGLTTSLHRWSPSGKVTDLRIADVNGVGGWLESAAITANGRRMAIGVNRLEMHVWQIDLSAEGQGLKPRRLIASSLWDTSPEYSHDGRRLIFQSTRSGAPEAWLALADGSGVRQITHFGNVGDPKWAPDGTKIMFNSGEGGHENLWVAEVETGAVRRITNSPSVDSRGRWSHDGRWIYFDSDRTGRSEIWKIPDGGGQAVQLTTSGGTNPFESPDARYLYYGKESGGTAYVWRKPLGGGREERLFPSLVNYASLAMGTRHLYFVRNPRRFPGYGITIYSYELANGFIREVAEPGPEIVTLSPSPDERRLVYGAHEGSKADLLLVDDVPR